MSQLTHLQKNSNKSTVMDQTKALCFRAAKKMAWAWRACIRVIFWKGRSDGCQDPPAVMDPQGLGLNQGFWYSLTALPSHSAIALMRSERKHSADYIAVYTLWVISWIPEASCNQEVNVCAPKFTSYAEHDSVMFGRSTKRALIWINVGWSPTATDPQWLKIKQ